MQNKPWPCHGMVYFAYKFKLHYNIYTLILTFVMHENKHFLMVYHENEIQDKE